MPYLVTGFRSSTSNVVDHAPASTHVVTMDQLPKSGGLACQMLDRNSLIFKHMRDMHPKWSKNVVPTSGTRVSPCGTVPNHVGQDSRDRKDHFPLLEAFFFPSSRVTCATSIKTSSARVTNHLPVQAIVCERRRATASALPYA